MSQLNHEPWTNVSPEDFNEQNSKYNEALLEQYKIYAEMADRISQRRNMANTFFLAFNAAILSAITAMLPKYSISASWLLPLLITLWLQCGVWLLMTRSYRLLNSSKYRIIGAMEERLPAKPWKKEWEVLEGGKGTGKHFRFTELERWVPVTFALIYAGGYLAILFR